MDRNAVDNMISILVGSIVGLKPEIDFRETNWDETINISSTECRYQVSIKFTHMFDISWQVARRVPYGFDEIKQIRLTNHQSWSLLNYEKTGKQYDRYNGTKW